MQPLQLYFNELCLKVVFDGPSDAYGISECAILFNQFFAVRADGKIAFPLNSWNEDFGGLPLRVHLSKHLSKDQYRRLLTRVKHISNVEIPLDREISLSDERGLGLTLADLAKELWGQGWAISIPIPNSVWLQASIAAERFVLNDQAELEGPTACVIDHLSNDLHVHHWQSALRDWGSTVAASSELALIDGHPVVMYSAPLEHGPAHVHLLESRNLRKTIAKYEIAQFRRYSGEPRWDTQMNQWITMHRDQLLRSWERCQRGGHPYVLE